jgi:hypothetical protein
LCRPSPLGVPRTDQGTEGHRRVHGPHRAAGTDRPADQHGLAYPSAERLAEDVDGLSRWHVRDAFAALQDNGIITHHGYVSRAKCWHIAFAEVREPATSPRDNVASRPPHGLTRGTPK